MEYITQSPQDTKSLGEKIATDIVGGALGSDEQKALVLALSGDLGAGKTTFVQGLAKGFGIDERILSPTFILVRQYDIHIEKQKPGHLYHLDLYRLETGIGDELMNLGVKDMWETPENVVVIEWAEKAKEVLPEWTNWVKFEYLDEEKRRIIF